MKDDGIIGKEFKKRAFTLPFRKKNAALSFEEKMAIAKLTLQGIINYIPNKWMKNGFHDESVQNQK
ncbi:MAG: hypothetical protein C6W58_10590 [Bacillaceae bacterium]|nr:MAG: hypothetical protein C6W58_10590 [Bacillaceae bacterium]